MQRAAARVAADGPEATHHSGNALRAVAGIEVTLALVEAVDGVLWGGAEDGEVSVRGGSGGGDEAAEK